MNASEVPIDEQVRQLLAGHRVRRDVAHDVSDAQTRAGSHLGPLDAGNRDVLPGGPRLQRVSLGVQCVDHLGGPQTDGLERSTVVFSGGLHVADETREVHFDAVDRALGNPARAGVQAGDDSVVERVGRARGTQRRRGRLDDAPHGFQQASGVVRVEARRVDSVEHPVESLSRIGEQVLATFRHLLQDGARGADGVAGVLESESVGAHQHGLTIDNVVGP